MRTVIWKNFEWVVIDTLAEALLFSDLHPLHEAEAASLLRLNYTDNVFLLRAYRKQGGDGFMHVAVKPYRAEEHPLCHDIHCERTSIETECRLQWGFGIGGKVFIKKPTVSINFPTVMGMVFVNLVREELCRPNPMLILQKRQKELDTTENMLEMFANHCNTSKNESKSPNSF